MPTLFHVTSSAHRASIERHGLDWTRMGSTARGIAGSTTPEVAGVFLCRDEGEVRFFLGFGTDGEVLDVWAVDGVEDTELVLSPEGFGYVPRRVPASRVTLVRTVRTRNAVPDTDPGGAYASTLTLTFDNRNDHA